MIQFVVTTLPDETSAAAIVRELVEMKLAACGTLLPSARSIYRWKDSIEDTSEVVVIFKIPSKSFSVFPPPSNRFIPTKIPRLSHLIQPRRPRSIPPGYSTPASST